MTVAMMIMMSKTTITMMTTNMMTMMTFTRFHVLVVLVCWSVLLLPTALLLPRILTSDKTFDLVVALIFGFQ